MRADKVVFQRVAYPSRPASPRTKREEDHRGLDKQDSSRVICAQPAPTRRFTNAVRRGLRKSEQELKRGRRKGRGSEMRTFPHSPAASSVSPRRQP